MFSPYKDKIEVVYASLKTDLKIEDYGEPEKFLGIELDLFPDRSMNQCQNLVKKWIIHFIANMDKANSKGTTLLPPPTKNKGYQMRKNDFSY